MDKKFVIDMINSLYYRKYRRDVLSDDKYAFGSYISVDNDGKSIALVISNTSDCMLSTIDIEIIEQLLEINEIDIIS